MKPVDESDKPKPSKIDNAYTPNSHTVEEYEREVPERFSEVKDDRLMHSLITKYSLEGRTDDKPNGHFYMTKDAMQKATDEVIGTHYQFSGQRKENMVKDTMSNYWPRYDVNNDGFIEVQRAAVFLRQALGNVEASIGL